MNNLFITSVIKKYYSEISKNNPDTKRKFEYREKAVELHLFSR